MADLSKVDTRSANQTRGRLTDRRAGILPERRDTRADRLQSFATMSSAQRGDGGAEALMQTLGMVREAAGDFQQYADTKFKKDEEDNAARGALDQATDKVDEEKAGRSYAYRNAVARGRTMTAWNGGLKDFRDDLRGVVEQQNQLTLEERQAEVRQHVETFYKGFAIDPDTGKLRDFLATPDSMRYLGEQMQLGRPQFEDAALQRIEERFNEEAVTHFSQNLMDQALAGQPVDLALSLAILPPTVPDEARRAAIVNTFITVSTQLRDQKRFAEGERLLTQLLSGYVDAAGRPIETIADGLAVHPDILAARLDGTHRPDPAEPLSLSPDGKQLVILGGDPVSFKSDIQIKILRTLVEGFKENKRYTADELLSRAGSGVTTLQRAFGNAKWAQLSPFIKSTNGLWAFEF